MSPIHILLVEDNEGDIVLTLEALKDVKTPNKISVVRNGEEAIQFLDRTVPFTEASAPDLILLDIYLPLIDGKEVLKYVKTHSDHKIIPVVMLSSSVAPNDILESYQGHANCYISKPTETDQYFDMVKKVENFWVSIVDLPKTNHHGS
ncbi:MAG: response regulator [Bacteroidota bacterium]